MLRILMNERALDGLRSPAYARRRAWCVVAGIVHLLIEHAIDP
jgi:hypothetical protein